LTGRERTFVRRWRDYRDRVGKLEEAADPQGREPPLVVVENGLRLFGKFLSGVISMSRSEPKIPGTEISVAIEWGEPLPEGRSEDLGLLAQSFAPLQQLPEPQYLELLEQFVLTIILTEEASEEHGALWVERFAPGPIWVDWPFPSKDLPHAKELTPAQKVDHLTGSLIQEAAHNRFYLQWSEEALIAEGYQDMEPQDLEASQLAHDRDLYTYFAEIDGHLEQVNYWLDLADFVKAEEGRNAWLRQLSGHRLDRIYQTINVLGAFVERHPDALTAAGHKRLRALRMHWVATKAIGSGQEEVVVEQTTPANFTSRSGQSAPAGTSAVFVVSGLQGRTRIRLFAQAPLFDQFAHWAAEQLRELPEGLFFSVTALPADPAQLQAPGLVLKDAMLDLPFPADRSILAILEKHLSDSLPALETVLFHALTGKAGQVKALIGMTTWTDANGKRIFAFFV